MIGPSSKMPRDPLSVLPMLRDQVRRLERPAATAHGVLPFGAAAIDRALPGGGLARGALHEVLGAGGDGEDGALAAAFVAGILARLVTAVDGIVLWCLARPDLHGAGLAACGLDPARLMLVRTARDSELLWAMEEGLRTSGVAAVVGEVGAFPAVASRRLQLAAERSGVTAFVLRRWCNGGQAARERNLPNAAATRWQIAALPSRPVTRFREGGDSRAGSGIGHPCWRVELLRCRGGEPAGWDVEVREGKMVDATDIVSLAEALADRPMAPGGGDTSPPEAIRRVG